MNHNLVYYPQPNTTYPNRILVIDDDEINNYIATALIKKVSPETEIMVCKSGEDALALLTNLMNSGEKAPDYIFVDLAMKGMDGWEVLDNLHDMQISPEVQVIVLTSSVFRHDIERANAHPASNDFISKPLSSKLLNELFSVERKVGVFEQ